MADKVTRSTDTRQIALAFPAAQAHLHAVVRGVVDYARAHGRWLLTTSVEAATLPLESLEGWKGDGVIGIVASEQEVKAARRLRRQGIPVVTFSGSLPRPGVPRVSVDNAAVGRLAAEHLLARGFDKFAFYGLTDRAYSDLRGDAFVAAVERAGGQVAVHRCESTGEGHRPWQKEFAALGKWLAGLDKPVAIFAVNDFRARLVIDACGLRGIPVPGEVAVVGADNNPVVCEFSDPPISSVACDWRRVGFEAAALLDRLMHGEAEPAADIRVPPHGVERRQSTDVLATEDPHVNRAVAYLRDHMGEVFGVERLLEATGISRRSLETAFQSVLHCSPYRYLCEARVDQAKRLLLLPGELKMSEVARRCGFPDARRFRVVFERVAGMAPSAYRRQRDPRRD